METNRATKSGINADMVAKREKSYDVEAEKKARSWMENITGEPLEGDFFVALQDGSYICKLFNKLFESELKGTNIIEKKHLVPVKHPFKQMANISAFLDACKRLGMDESDLFVSVDLQEAQNKNMVLAAIYNLGRRVQKDPNYTGPILGPKEAEPQPRYFDEQTLREGRNVSSLQYGTNQVASQKGATPFGMGRQVYDQKLDQ